MVEDLRKKLANADLDKKSRVALIRVIYDIVVADKIIDDEEVQLVSNLFNSDNDRELFKSAKQMTLGDACKELARSLKDNQKRIVLAIVNAVIGCDGNCAPQEAILKLALNWCLNPPKISGYKVEPRIVSSHLSDVFIGKRTAMIIGSSPSMSLCADDIKDIADVVSNLFAAIGFKFIIIERQRKIYEKKGLAFFKQMATCFFPEIEESVLEERYNSLITLSTKRFTEEVLGKKLEFEFSDAKDATGKPLEPHLLLMIGRSDVLSSILSDKGLKSETYAHFLLIPLSVFLSSADNDEERLRKQQEFRDPFVELVNKIVNDFNAAVTLRLICDFNPSNSRLQYHGFFKALFQLVAVSESELLKINIDTKRGEIFLNGHIVQLKPSTKAILALILSYSARNEKIFHSDEQSPERKEKISNDCRLIYNQLKGKSTVTVFCNRWSPNISDMNSKLQELIKKGDVNKKYESMLKTKTDVLFFNGLRKSHLYINDVPYDGSDWWTVST